MEDQIAAKDKRDNAKWSDPNFKLKQANYQSYYQSETDPNLACHKKGGQY